MTTSTSSELGVNLALLPEARFAETDVAAVEASVLAAYEGLTGTTLQPGDPVRLFLESLAYVVGVQNAVIEQAGRQGLLAYAEGAHLDHLGALMGVSRLPAQPARLSLRFSLSEALPFAVPVPAGTRAATSAEAGFMLDAFSAMSKASTAALKALMFACNTESTLARRLISLGLSVSSCEDKLTVSVSTCFKKPKHSSTRSCFKLIV